MCGPSANNRLRRFLKDARRIDYLSLQAWESHLRFASVSYGEAVAPGGCKTKRNTCVPGGLAPSGSIRNP